MTVRSWSQKWGRAQGNKFNNRKTEYNSNVYDSKMEAEAAQMLDLLVRANRLLDVQRQVRYELRGPNGGHICDHIVDFLVTGPDGQKKVFEVKGFQTDVWKLKKKLFEDTFPDIPYVVAGTKNKHWETVIAEEIL